MPKPHVSFTPAERVRVQAADKVTQPDYDLHCTQCGRAHYLDTSIPSAIWNQIAEPHDILCTLCIDQRLSNKGLTAEAEFYYVGTALVSRLYENSYGEPDPLDTPADLRKSG